MLSGPVALQGFKSLKRFQVLLSIISFTFNVVYLPSVFQIISTKLLIRYIRLCDIGSRFTIIRKINRPS